MVRKNTFLFQDVFLDAVPKRGHAVDGIGVPDEREHRCTIRPRTHAREHRLVGHVLERPVGGERVLTAMSNQVIRLGIDAPIKAPIRQGVVCRVGLEVVAGDQTGESIMVRLYFQQLVSLSGKEERC